MPRSIRESLESQLLSGLVLAHFRTQRSVRKSRVLCLFSKNWARGVRVRASAAEPRSSRRLRVGGNGRRWLLARFAPLVEGRGQTSEQNRLASRRTAFLPHATLKDSSR